MKTNHFKIKDMFKITSKSLEKPELQLLYVKNNIIWATDAFKAIGLNMDFENKEGFITEINATVSDMETKKFNIRVLPKLEDLKMSYPDVQKVIPESNKEDSNILINRKYLIDLLSAMQEGKDFDKISLTISGTKLVIKNNNGVGILMGLIK